MNIVRIWLTLLTAIFCCTVKAEIDVEKLVKQKWYIATTSNFTVLTDRGERVATEMATNLERFRAMLEMTTGMKISGEIRPVKVFATKRQRTYEFLVGDKKRARKTVGFFKDTTKGNYSALRLMSRSKSIDLSILMHEYTHYVSSNTLSVTMPYWYNEGQAEFLGATKFKDDQVLIYGVPVAHHLHTIMDLGWMPLEELLNTSYINYKKSRKRHRFYAQGWLLVHYLNSTPELSQQRTVFLTALNNGDSLQDATQSAFGISVKELNKQLRLYSRGNLYYTQIKLTNPLNVDEITMRQLEPHEIAYEFGEFALQARGSLEDSLALLEKAIALKPDYAAALAGLAKTFLRKDLDKMLELIEKAKAIDTDSPWVATISGHLNGWRYRREKDQTKKREYWNLAVRDYNRAIMAGTANLEAITAAASLYSGSERWDRHLELIEQAFDIAPKNFSIRTLLILSYLKNDDFDSAEIIADLIRHNHHMSDAQMQRFEKWYQRLKDGEEY